MVDRNDDKHLQDNAGKQHEPKNSRHENRAPPGSVGMSPRGPGAPTKGLTPSSQALIAGTPDKEAARNFSKDHQLSDKVNPQDYEVTRKEKGPLSKEHEKSAKNDDRTR